VVYVEIINVLHLACNIAASYGFIVPESTLIDANVSIIYIPGYLILNNKKPFSKNPCGRMICA